MSNSIQPNVTPVAEFQAHFGAPPGSQDARGDCERWERLCAELLAERARLQAELVKARAENEANMRSLVAMVCKDLTFDLTLTREQVYAQVDKTTSLDQLIAELEHEAEKA